MKKLLTLMLVLGMASLANAALTLQISVDGNLEPVDSEIYVIPSETIYLDIWTTADITPGVGEGYYALACSTADATISGGVVNFPGEPGLSIEDDPVGVGIPVPAGHNGVWGMIALSTVSEIPAGTILFNEIGFHCEWAPNDVMVTLYDADTMEILDTVTIHQIPEPATMALLSLGGLLLLRRRK